MVNSPNGALSLNDQKSKSRVNIHTGIGDSEEISRMKDTLTTTIMRRYDSQEEHMKKQIM